MQRFAIAHLHIIGDIYDRGNGAHLIMDRLESYHSLDIQWGNHDILWMAAASGCLAAIASAIRISLRYGSIETLEEGLEFHFDLSLFLPITITVMTLV
jgi:fructose-1,6-bisphosphatase-3